METLFSFEVLVEYVLIDKGGEVSDELALAVRMLDFPTLLIHHLERKTSAINQCEHHGEDKKYYFQRGKSCFFKINPDSLHGQLSNTPLYVMVLDVKEDIPKLVGTSLVSLSKVMDRINWDVKLHGVSTPSSHGERGLVGICNLVGEKIGSISLSYKLANLGTSLQAHISENKKEDRGKHIQQNKEEKQDVTAETDSGCIPTAVMDKSVCTNTQNNGSSNEYICVEEEKQDIHVCVSTQTENKSRNKELQPFKETESTFEEKFNVFCPPKLFYSNILEEKSKNEAQCYKFSKLHLEPLTLDETSSEDEMPEDRIAPPVPPVTEERARHNAKPSSDREQSNGVGPNVLREALGQLPLLNALLVELSQLNGPNQHQPLSIHPHLSWLYRPSSTDPSAGRENSSQESQTKSQQKTREVASPVLKYLNSPRNHSTPRARPTSERAMKKAPGNDAQKDKPPRKKLVYGTTKTFNLRLKQNAFREAERECVKLMRPEALSDPTKGKINTPNKLVKYSKVNSMLNKGSDLCENVETVIGSITVNSTLNKTITLKRKNTTADQTWSECDGIKERTDASRSSRVCSPKSSLSESSRDGREEEEYADDFTSLDTSDAYSPDPVSSPEPAGAKMQKSPVCLDVSNSDSGSEGVQKRHVHPVPIQACSSPQQSLMGTHIIRPRTQASGLSFSSNDEDGDGSASVQTVRSRKLGRDDSRDAKSPGAESLTSSRGQSGFSTKNSSPVRGLSVETKSPFYQHDLEEIEDELGSLDFRNKYQHISELVANKLPGYIV
ncbi:microtubule-associated protein 10 [Genypterus blacodes]|uniref:microtubule-associated protein 10 n=1 Tax=Genypterus blacodes TaxID=154954 RepID=UPI003F76E7A5